MKCKRKNNQYIVLISNIHYTPPEHFYDSLPVPPELLNLPGPDTPIPATPHTRPVPRAVPVQQDVGVTIKDKYLKVRKGDE